MKHRFYPAALNVKGKRCIVIGSDEAIVKKAGRLAEAGADVTTVDLDGFRPDLLTDQFLAVLTHEADRALAQSVAQRCREKKILLAALDHPDLCDVIHVSVFERGPLRMGISTEGVAPGLSRMIRQGLEESLAKAPIEEFLEGLAELRARVEREVPDFSERRKLLLAALEGFEFHASVKLPRGSSPSRR